MLIEWVRIAGFKSFREESVFDLTSGLNVVVGPNGVGKSNIISAIQFALTDEYGKCSPNERNALLYNGKQQRNDELAFVEIKINNVSRRLPVDSDNVIFKRIFGSNKDKLLVNGQEFPESRSFLESAGFTNSYFVVKQGKISLLATTTDQQRLHDLKEIAGINSYDGSLRKIEQSSKELEIIRTEIETRTLEIQERIKTLENQREELENIASLDTEKRSIEYVILKQDYDNVQHKLIQLKDEMKQKLSLYETGVQPKKERINKLSQLIADTEKIIAFDETRFNRIKSNKVGTETEIEQLVAKEARSQQELADLNEELEGAESQLESARRDSELLQQEIDMKTSKMNLIVEKHEALRAKELTAKQKWVKKDAKLKSLERIMNIAAEKGATSQSHRKAIKDESILVSQHISKLSNTIAETETSLKNRQEELKTLEVKLDKCAQNVKDLYLELSSIIQCITEENKILEAFHDRRNILQQEENRLKQTMSINSDIRETHKECVRKSVGRVLYLGWEGISNIAAELFGTQVQEEDTGFYRTVLDNFKCEEQFYTAVEVTGGSRLLNFIVKDHTISRRLMKEFNDRKLPGEVNFVSLGNIYLPNTNTNKFNGDTNHNDAVIKLVDYLEFTNVHTAPAMKLIFGNTLLCRSYQGATAIAKKYKMNCVTLDGDKTNKSGAITGGYINSSASKIRAFTEFQKWDNKILECYDKLEKLQNKLGKLESNILIQMKVNEQKETQRNNTQRNIEQETCKKSILHLNKRELENGIAEDNKRLNDRKVELAEFQSTAHTLEEQLKQPFTSQPNAHELNQIQKLRQEVKGLARVADTLFKEIINFEKQKTKVQNELDLIYANEAVKGSMNEAKIICEDLSNRQTSVQNALRTTQETLKEKHEYLNHLVFDNIPKTEETLRLMKAKHMENKDEKLMLKKEVTHNHPHQSALQRHIIDSEGKFDDTNGKLQSYGVVPSNIKNYQNKSKSHLYTQLRKVNTELEKYNSVCRLPQDCNISSLDEIQEEINSRRAELDNGFERIKQAGEFIATYKQKRFLHFFRILQRNFRQVFCTLVPSGHANLILYCRNYAIENIDENSELPDVAEEDMIGVKISASFSTGSFVKDMKQLSGGQKSVIAVALILAIQKLDPIPIYLFDEIDSALDSDYREAVASVIDGMSSEVQFLCTTHRAEFAELAKNHVAVGFRNNTSVAKKITPEGAVAIVKTFESDVSLVTTSSLDSTISSFQAPNPN